jgi:hypothetical protein
VREKALVLSTGVTTLFHIEQKFTSSFQPHFQHGTGGFGQYLDHVLPPAVSTIDLIDPILVHASYVVNMFPSIPRVINVARPGPENENADRIRGRRSYLIG